MTLYVTATYRDGQLVPDEPIHLPEGQKVFLAVAADAQSVHSLDCRPEEAHWIDDPVLNKQRAEAINALEPLEVTPEEEAEFEAFRQQVKKYTLDAMRQEKGLDG
jgi:predicted DNA-binding antitoxin AbrB/MazE fold protein